MVWYILSERKKCRQPVLNLTSVPFTKLHPNGIVADHLPGDFDGLLAGHADVDHYETEEAGERVH